jgi:hypothetical protein
VKNESRTLHLNTKIKRNLISIIKREEVLKAQTLLMEENPQVERRILSRSKIER